MRIAVAGGGPGGLYFAALARELLPRAEITVWERNAPDDTFGFGVVFSDETLGGIENADPLIYRQMEREFARWDDIDVHYRGQVITSGGHGFAAMGRRRLLEILQQRCADLGVTVHFRRPGARRRRARGELRPGRRRRRRRTRRQERRGRPRSGPNSRFETASTCGSGTDLVFDCFKFYVEQTPYGVMQVHGYPYDATGSTFIVEMNDAVWRAAGFADLAAAAAELAPGESDEASIERVGRAVRRTCLASTPCWPITRAGSASRTLRCESWRDGNIVLLGDAAHTAHFSIGSGHQAGDGGCARARGLPARARRWPARSRRRSQRRDRGRAGGVRGRAAAGRGLDAARGPGQPGVVREPRPVHRPGARAVRVQHHDPQPPGHARQPPAARSGIHRPMDAWFAGDCKRRGLGAGDVVPPMFQPFRLRSLELPNRVVVSAMDMYSARTGCRRTSIWCTSAARRSAGPAWS